MGSRRDGNAAKRVVTEEPAPWVSGWPKARHARAIRFIETFCVPEKGFRAGEPLKLAGFQKAWLEEVYAEGVGSAAMKLPRGNGKSTFLGAVATHALFDEDETGAPQVPMVATTIGQALKTTYGAALAFVRGHDVLAERALVYSAIGGQKILTPHNHGELFPVSNDPDGLQGLDPSLAVCDEIGFMPIQSWDSLLLASGKRPRSLVVGIGTPGFDKQSALWHLETQVRSGATLPGFHWTAYEADEGCRLDDEAQWEKANPALSEGYMNVEALRTAVALSPEAHFRIFRLGQWVEGVQSWLGDDGRTLWRSLDDPWDMEPGAPTWVGIDVGLRRDSTGVVWCQRRPDGRRHVVAKVWLPQQDGRLDVTDIMAHVRDLGEQFELVHVAYDPRLFELPAQQLADEGYPMLEWPQSLERMSPAAGEAFEAIKTRRLSHDGDPVLEAQVLNAVARFNERGFTLAKSKSKNRIDACVAMVMCLAAESLPAVEPLVPLVAMA